MTDDLRETTPEGVSSIVGVRGAPFHRRGAAWPWGGAQVIDATNVQPEARKPLLELAPERPLPAIILQSPALSQINHDAF